jgi:hypothetical protein
MLFVSRVYASSYSSSLALDQCVGLLSNILENLRGADWFELLPPWLEVMPIK